MHPTQQKILLPFLHDISDGSYFVQPFASFPRWRMGSQQFGAVFIGQRSALVEAMRQTRSRRWLVMVKLLIDNLIAVLNRINRIIVGL